MSLRKRSRELLRIRLRLERDGYPRLQMLLLVGITSAAGFMASAVLLHFGLTTMWLRYILAVALAYVVFLVLLWLWIRTKAHDYVDLPDVGLVPTSPSSTSGEFSGQGGEGGGGGASGSFDSSGLSDVPDTFSPVKEVASVTAEAEELAIPIIALAFLVVLVFSSLWAIYAAPVLFAELVLDGLLAATLYRRLKRLEIRHWLETAVRRTFVPFIGVGVLMAAIGFGFSLYAPEAYTLGDFVQTLRASK